MEFMGLGDNLNCNMIVEYSKMIDPRHLGHLSGLDTGLLDEEKKDEIIRIITATMMFTYLDTSFREGNTTIRELSPSFDLLDADSTHISSMEWIQVTPKDTAVFDIRDVYEISINPNNAKIICIYAIKIPSEGTNVEEIYIWRKGTKLVERLMLSGHDLDREIMLNSPIILGYPSYSKYSIKFKYGKEKRDYNKIKLCGYVCEKVGFHILPR